MNTPSQPPSHFEAVGSSETVFVARGELNQPDKELVQSLLGRFGLSITFMHPNEVTYEDGEAIRNADNHEQHDQLETIARKGYRFADIRHREDILVKEHFEDFLRTARPQVTKGIATRAFHYLVDGSCKPLKGRAADSLYEWNSMAKPGKGLGERILQIREPRPLNGIEVVRRAEKGFPLYERTLDEPDKIIIAKYGIVAGSLLDATQTNSLITTGESVTRRMIKEMINHLHAQIV